jgi:tetratricopeptide (TPR) repeat protein
VPRDQVFISYSHKDRKWRNDLDTHLKPYLRGGSIVSWSDQQIAPGSEWVKEIQSALANSNVAVLLVSPAFLASDFIHEHELGPLLKEAEKGGVRILWVPVRASSYKKTALKDYQAVLDPSKPLASMRETDRDLAWVRICEEIEGPAQRSMRAPEQTHPARRVSKKAMVVVLGAFAVVGVVICLVYFSSAQAEYYWNVGKYKEAWPYLNVAAYAGISDCMYKLGDMYKKPLGGVPIDPTKAREWYKKAADADNEWGMYNLGDMYKNGWEGVPPDYRQAKDWFDKAIKKHNNTWAMYYLGEIYEYGGFGVDKNYEDAEKLYPKGTRRRRHAD